jgi:hypothetical protein
MVHHLVVHEEQWLLNGSVVAGRPNKISNFSVRILSAVLLTEDVLRSFDKSRLG